MKNKICMRNKWSYCIQKQKAKIGGNYAPARIDG